MWGILAPWLIMIYFVTAAEIVLDKKRQFLSWRTCTPAIILFVLFLLKISHCSYSIHNKSKQWDRGRDWLSETCPKCAPKRSTEINLSCRGRWLPIKAEKNYTGSHGDTFKWENGFAYCIKPCYQRVYVCMCLCAWKSQGEIPRDREWKRENKRKGGKEKGRKKEISRDTQM